jgi:hypothetical protein
LQHSITNHPYGQELIATNWLILAELLLPRSAHRTPPFFGEVFKWSTWVDIVFIVPYPWLINIPANTTFEFGHHLRHLLFLFICISLNYRARFDISTIYMKLPSPYVT